MGDYSSILTLKRIFFEKIEFEWMMICGWKLCVRPTM